MGYYVIPDLQGVPLQSFYVENYADIVLVGGISGKSIIYPVCVANIAIVYFFLCLLFKAGTSLS